MPGHYSVGWNSGGPPNRTIRTVLGGRENTRFVEQFLFSLRLNDDAGVEWVVRFSVGVWSLVKRGVSLNFL